MQSIRNLKSYDEFISVAYSAELTEFAKRHFDKGFGGTKVLSMSPEQFIHQLRDEFVKAVHSHSAIVINGYADFCKLVPVKNFTDARSGSLPITLENYQYLRSGYSARTEDELPVLSRWLELPLGKPIASILMIILYSKEQIDREAKVDAEKNGTKFVAFPAPWGIVSINGQMHAEEEPMHPATALRNALGPEEGGSGVPINRDAYQRSVDFWSTHASVK
jgi:hypothetical protein